MTTRRGTKRKAAPSESPREKRTFTEERLNAVLAEEKTKLLSAWLTDEEVKTPKAQLEEAMGSVQSVYDKFVEARKKYYQDNKVSKTVRVFESFYWTKLDEFFASMMEKDDLKKLMFKHLALICKE